MRILVLFNPIAGSGRAAAAAETLARVLAREGHEPALKPTEPDPAVDWLDAALSGVEALLVVGGDGAVRLAARPAMRRGTPLLVHPMGTENLFAREVGVGRSTGPLLAALRRFEVRRVDVGRVNGEDFLLMASIGPDADAVADLAARRRGGIGHLSWTGPLLRQLFRWRAPELTVSVDDEVVVERRRGMLVVGNSRHYALRFDPAVRASMTDGRLDAVFFPCRAAPAAALWMLRCRFRRQLATPRVVYRPGARISVACRPEQPFQIDGDPPGGASPTGRLELSLEPRALPVLVP